MATRPASSRLLQLIPSHRENKAERRRLGVGRRRCWADHPGHATVDIALGPNASRENCRLDPARVQWLARFQVIAGFRLPKELKCSMAEMRKPMKRRLRTLLIAVLPVLIGAGPCAISWKVLRRSNKCLWPRPAGRHRWTQALY